MGKSENGNLKMENRQPVEGEGLRVREFRSSRVQKFKTLRRRAGHSMRRYDLHRLTPHRVGRYI